MQEKGLVCGQNEIGRGKQARLSLGREAAIIYQVRLQGAERCGNAICELNSIVGIV